MTLEQLAQDFATYHHTVVNQRRKYTGDPYITHPAAVVEIVRSVPHTEEMIAAAWLHDTVEDTAATIEDVLAAFGAEVAELVGWLTDVSRPEDGNRAARKALDRDHIAAAPASAKTIKLADLIHNTGSIVEHDTEFARIYLGEKRQLLDVLHQGDQTLWRRARILATANP